MGFFNKVHHDRVHISMVIFVLISILIIGAIHDLDTPDSGMIKPNFEDIRDVKEYFQHYLEK
jgi:hypothetical protein